MRILPVLCLLLTTVAPSASFAQSGDVITLRVGKLEKEMKAVQRRVFAEGVPVEPEIGGTTSLPDGSPAGSPISDLTSRVDAIEAQQKTLTGEVERQSFRLKRTEDALKAMEARLKALEPDAVINAPANDTPALAPKPVAVTPMPKPVAVAPKPVAVAPKPVQEATVKAPVTNDPKRKALVDAVPIPVTNDPIEDSYSYGFRLWAAKLYPEAQRHLKSFITKYPTHKRESHARNLLGRSYFDDRLYNAASKSFLENYQDNAKGDRAAESLSWLGLALQRLSPPQIANACKVYKEFEDVYGDTAASDVRARVAKGRADAKCPA